MWINYNANPVKNAVEDCVVRAISYILGQSWERTLIDLTIESLIDYDMPHANIVWDRYLARKGYKKHLVNEFCEDGYTVRHFCEMHPAGKYILGISGHVVAAENGNYYDTWDSGDCIPLYYWCKEDNA